MGHMASLAICYISRIGPIRLMRSLLHMWPSRFTVPTASASLARQRSTVPTASASLARQRFTVPTASASRARRGSTGSDRIGLVRPLADRAGRLATAEDGQRYWAWPGVFTPESNVTRSASVKKYDRICIRTRFRSRNRNVVFSLPRVWHSERNPPHH